MEKNYSKIIANNLIELRKAHNFTQLDVAEKLNYTDKSVSKWELGEITPSIEVLCQIADLYGNTLEDLISEKNVLEPHREKKREINRAIITCLAVSIVWMLACIAFVYAKISYDTVIWPIFIWAIPVSCIVALVFNSIWGSAKIGFWIISILIWTLLAAVYLQFIGSNWWPIFMLGIPGQIAVILWSKLK